jgi:hypothetical protein
MHRLAIAPVLVSAGCLLYTGDLNHPPECKVTTSMPNQYKGTRISFTVSLTDPDGDKTRINQPTLEASDGQPITNCDYANENLSDGTFVYQFYRTGTFKLTFSGSDIHGAPSNYFAVEVPISNAPPTFTSAATIKSTGNRDSCGFFTVGDAIPLQLSEMPMDADVGAGKAIGNCSTEKLSYQWQVTAPPGSVAPALTAWSKDTGCGARPASGVTTLATEGWDDQVCLWGDAGMRMGSTYGITLTVSDGSAQATVNGSLMLAPEGPPCLDGVTPDAGYYAVDPKNPAPFDTLKVRGVLDELDAYPGGEGQLTFYWSLWREKDPEWRHIAVNQPEYSPDYSLFGVGEHVRIRVEVYDRTQVRANCDLNVDDCAVLSCVTMATTCNQWTTWNLELR